MPMRIAVLFSALVLVAIAATADPLPGPVPDALIVTYNGLDWVWASPCSGLCSMPLPSYQEGWRYATGEEWELRPDPTAFLGPDGFKCAAAYFDPVWQHCDYDDGALGLLTSLPNGERHESWFVRGSRSGEAAVPEPASLMLVGAGLVVLGGRRLRQ